MPCVLLKIRGNKHWTKKEFRINQEIIQNEQVKSVFSVLGWFLYISTSTWWWAVSYCHCFTEQWVKESHEEGLNPICSFPEPLILHLHQGTWGTEWGTPWAGCQPITGYNHTQNLTASYTHTHLTQPLTHMHNLTQPLTPTHNHTTFCVRTHTIPQPNTLTIS